MKTLTNCKRRKVMEITFVIIDQIQKYSLLGCFYIVAFCLSWLFFSPIFFSFFQTFFNWGVRLCKLQLIILIGLVDLFSNKLLIPHYRLFCQTCFLTEEYRFSNVERCKRDLNFSPGSNNILLPLLFRLIENL